MSAATASSTEFRLHIYINIYNRFSHSCNHFLDVLKCWPTHLSTEAKLFHNSKGNQFALFTGTNHSQLKVSQENTAFSSVSDYCCCCCHTSLCTEFLSEFAYSASTAIRVDNTHSGQLHSKRPKSQWTRLIGCLEVRGLLTAELRGNPRRTRSIQMNKSK